MNNSIEGGAAFEKDSSCRNPRWQIRANAAAALLSFYIAGCSGEGPRLEDTQLDDTQVDGSQLDGSQLESNQISDPATPDTTQAPVIPATQNPEQNTPQQTDGQTTEPQNESENNQNGTNTPTADSPLPENEQTITLQLSFPQQLVNSPVVSPDNVYPQVSIANQPIAMSCCDNNGRWSGSVASTTLLASGSPISIRWYEDFQGQQLELANNMFSTTGLVDSANNAPTVFVTLSGDGYGTSIDSDGDTFDNLSERENGSNPTDGFDFPGSQPSSTDAPAPAIDAAVDVVVPRIDTANAPQIDGAPLAYQAGTTLAGEWAATTQRNRNGQRLNIANLMIDTQGVGLTPHNHHWAMTHDGTWLYLLVISDDAGLQISDSDEERKIWKDDDLEIYFDGNNSKLPNYDGVDDFHLHINLTERLSSTPNHSTNPGARFLQAINSASLPSDLAFSTGLRNGPVSPRPGAGRQDIYEIRIRLSELNITVGQPFGFEVQLNDDDDGGDRDTKWGWKHPVGTATDNDFTWRDPSFMGTVLLLP